MLKGHTHYVRCLAFSPDGDHLISAGWDKELRWWDPFTGDCLHVFSGHSEVIEVVALSPDGRTAASSGSGGSDRTLRLWNLESSDESRVISDNIRRIDALVFSPDGRYLISGEDDGSIRVWDVALEKCLRSFKGHSQPVTSLALTRDGCWLVSGGSDRLMKLWRLDWDILIPEGLEPDETFTVYLEAFLRRNRPYSSDGFSRSGRPVWTQEDFKVLVEDLEFRGYGSIPADVIQRQLREMAR